MINCQHYFVTVVHSFHVHVLPHLLVTLVSVCMYVVECAGVFSNNLMQLARGFDGDDDMVMDVMYGCD